MRIIGIDPGTINVGYGIIDTVGNSITSISHGTIFLDKKQAIEFRLAQIHSEITSLLDRYLPDEGAIEKAFVSKNVHSALRLGEGRGVAMAAMGLFGIPVVEYAPLVIKKAVVGRGHSSKDQVRAMVKIILKCPDNFASDDTADALGVAICHTHRRLVRSL
ncbi:MAG: crossover junction endodeoxyribonuclease RuvC [Planctomycetota bacterium]|nr:MAG: crossover junction endodeoxyribonuclease RuvC [Planctomycetota bacterium]